MAARTIGSATISFGLVSVPVNLFSSSESSAAISFNMIHTKCGSRLKQQYICAREGMVVEKDQVSKGYEFSKDQYVLFTSEEIKALDEKATNTIDIAEFVPLATVDRIYLEKLYYLFLPAISIADISSPISKAALAIPAIGTNRVNGATRLAG